MNYTSTFSVLLHLFGVKGAVRVRPHIAGIWIRIRARVRVSRRLAFLQLLLLLLVSPLAVPPIGVRVKVRYSSGHFVRGVIQRELHLVVCVQWVETKYSS